MKVKDVIELACVFLNKQDLLETSLFDSVQPDVTDEQQNEIGTLVRCLNLVVGEICCDYIPLVESEEIEVTGGKFEFSNLKKIAMEILAIRTQDGEKIRCKISPSFVLLPDGKYVVEYSYVPAKLCIDDDMPSFYCRVPDRVFAYGVAMEYSLLCSLYDEMDIWQTRFRDGIEIATQKHSEKRLPRRGWF
ncbi:MAG: hypothetical protein ACI4T2_03330 [Christensenellales bacterium]